MTTVGATMAYFTDTGEVKGVTFSTGNADLQLTQSYMGHWFEGDATAAELAINFPGDLYPGYEGSWGHADGIMYLGNFSDSPFNLTVNAKISDYSEDVAGLQDNVQLAIAWGGNCDPNGNGSGFHTLRWWKNNSVLLFEKTGGSVDPATCGFIPNDHSAGYQGYAKSIKFYLKVPESVGDAYTNGTANFNIHFDAEQEH